MANGGRDERPVTWGRFSATISAIEARIAVNEHALSALGQEGESRRNRAWVIVLAIMTGLICPVVVTAVVTWVHLKSGH
jgi:hypothetical protein